MVYSGTVHDIGTVIPDYVNTVYVPHVWYDQSKSYGNAANIFNELMVSEGMILGESEDDLWTMEEILTQILQYLNLHIIQNGFDYYIFDWETSRSADTVEWLDVFTGDTMTSTYDTVVIGSSMYASDDTQITMADVYNQVSVKDDITELKDVIMSPFDSDNLQDITYPQVYMYEYASPGEGDRSLENFHNIMNGEYPDAEYGKDDKEVSFYKEWCMKLRRASNWGFYRNGVDCYNNLPVDGNGNYYNQWNMPKFLHDNAFASAMVSFGSGNETNKSNIMNIQNITRYDDYICISINGNGVDEKSASFNPFGNNYTPPTQFPTDTDLYNSYMEIRYLNTTDGVYSSSTSDITNYLLFTGEIMLTIPQEYTGSTGYPASYGHPNHKAANIYTKDANDHKAGAQYVDWIVFTRNTNTFDSTLDVVNRSNYKNLLRYHVVPSEKNDDGMYYEQLFYDTAYPRDLNVSTDGTMVNLSPPIENGDLSKRFHYVLGNKSYYGEDDIIPYVDILACQLSIGDKYCEEYVEDGLKHFRWVTTEELMERPDGEGYEVLPDGSIRYKAYVNLAINIDSGDWLIGQKHQIYNNVFTNMGLDKTGMAIPLPHEDNLSGELKFSIIGPVNNVWDNGTRRHATWFRHSTTTPNYVSVLPHVGNIWISKFDVELVSDRGKNIEFDDADIVYRSDEQRRYVNKKDDVEFKFTTTLTADEAAQMRVNYTTNRSDVANSSGESILEITNNVTNETDKPERHYVDAYYREYSTPRMIVETTLHENDDIKMFNKFSIQYLNKTFHMLREEKNVKNATTKITVKEI